MAVVVFRFNGLVVGDGRWVQFEIKDEETLSENKHKIFSGEYHDCIRTQGQIHLISNLNLGLASTNSIMDVYNVTAHFRDIFIFASMYNSL